MSEFRPWLIDQPFVLPPSVCEFVPPGHLALMIRDLVREELDLRKIYRRYSKDRRGDELPPDALAKIRKLKQVRASMERVEAAAREKAERIATDRQVEPVFGHMKECRGWRRVLLRGLDKVRDEWAMMCTAHNLLKLVAARS